MLRLIAEKLEARGLVSASVWAEDMTMRGDLVRLYREYYEGKHRMKLTADMKRMMQINDERLDRYNVNYCQMVVNALTDRLTVQSVEAVVDGDVAGLEDYLRGVLPAGVDASVLARELAGSFGVSPVGEVAGQVWADDLLADNRFDAMQIEINRSLAVDGDTFVMSQYSDESKRVELAHEKAWDGQTGVMVVYDRQQKNVVAGVKVWWETGAQRVNIYYPDTVERYEVKVDESAGSSSLGQLGDPIDAKNERGLSEGVPIIHFKGGSALVNVIPLQDSLNQTLLSMVMSALLAGFPFLISMGVRIPNAQTPGMIIDVMSSAVQEAANSMDKELIGAVAGLMQAIKVERIEGGSLDQFIKQGQFLIEQIGTITHTPLPSQMGGDSSSGEALKQREIGLLGRANTLQVTMGNSYEDMVALAHLQETIYAVGNPPAVKRWNTVWKDAQIRNEADVRNEAEWYHNKGYERQALRIMGHEERDIGKLMSERAKDAEAVVDNVARGVAGFGQFEPMVIG